MSKRVQVLTMAKAKDCKHSVVYEPVGAVGAGGEKAEPWVKSVYVGREAAGPSGTMPQSVVVTVELGD